jgi:F0F1-type ATP synthase assembly protein I
MKKSEFDNSKKKIDQFIRYSSLAFEMMIIMAAGVFIGYKIDHWLNLSFPVFTLGLMIFSVIGSIFYAIKNFIK